MGDDVVRWVQAAGAAPVGEGEVGPDGGVAALGVEVPAGAAALPDAAVQVVLDVGDEAFLDVFARQDGGWRMTFALNVALPSPGPR